MRNLGATFLLLVMTLGAHGPVAAAEASPSPTPSPEAVEAPLVNPVCEQAFVGALPEPVEPSPTPSPESGVAMPDYLDAAVRACASLDDWSGAASLYPEALRGADALDLLAQRCADPAAELEVYATCTSLLDALASLSATPAPAPSLTPASTPSPAVTPTHEPAAKPTAQQPNVGADGLVRLPRKLKAHVPGATRIRYFNIAGRSPRTLVDQTLKRARKHCGIHNALACVNLSWQVRSTQTTASGSCTISDVGWTLRSEVHLPRWNKPNRVDPSLLRWWRKVLRQSAVHEARHIRIQRAQLAKLRGELIGRPCSLFDKVLKRVQNRSRKAQAAFDRRESRKTLPPPP